MRSEEGEREEDKFYSLLAYVLYVRTHGCDATFLCGFPARVASRRPFTNTPEPRAYELPTCPNSVQAGGRVLDFRGRTNTQMKTHIVMRDSTTESGLSARCQKRPFDDF